MILLNIMKFFYFQFMSIWVDGFLQGILGWSSSMFKFLKISARSAATFAEKHLGRATFTQIYAILKPCLIDFDNFWVTRWQFLADAGDALGLFLGLSVLQILHWLCSLYYYLLKTFNCFNHSVRQVSFSSQVHGPSGPTGPSWSGPRISNFFWPWFGPRFS